MGVFRIKCGRGQKIAHAMRAILFMAPSTLNMFLRLCVHTAIQCKQVSCIAILSKDRHVHVCVAMPTHRVGWNIANEWLPYANNNYGKPSGHCSWTNLMCKLNVCMGVNLCLYMYEWHVNWCGPTPFVLLTSCSNRLPLISACAYMYAVAYPEGAGAPP